MTDTNTTTKPGVLAELLDRWEARSRDALPADAMLINKHIRELREARATVERLLAADEEYDAALAAFNNTAATHPDWPQFHARFEAAKAQRVAALAAFRGDA